MKLSDYVVRFIADLGVKHVFLVPGGGAMHLNDSLARCPEIEFVCNQHEQASAIAAEAYAKVTNNLGVAMVTTGPGGTNAVTGVAGAWLDSTPCLFVSGQVKRADLKGNSGVRQLGVQEVDIVSIVHSITKYAVTVTSPETIQYHMQKALYLAKSGRPGPVWIDIPLDVQASEIQPDKLSSYSPPSDEPHGEDTLSRDIGRALDLMNVSERPVLLVGNGIRLAGAYAEFLGLVDLLQFPVLTTWLGLDLLPESHRLNAGRPGSMAPRSANFALQNSDLLLSIGARLDLAMCGYAYDKLARAAKKIIVDIDPAEIRKLTCKVDVPIAGDARQVIRRMLDSRSTIAQRDRKAWLDRCSAWKARYPVPVPAQRGSEGRVSAYVFSEALCEAMEDDLIVPGSSGFAPEIFFLVMRVKPGQRVLHTRGLGAMGFGLPASIGACLASGRRRTVSVDGDGGFQFNIQELETVARLQLPLKLFVVNNDGYASIRASQSGYFGRTIGCDSRSGLTLPDVKRIAAAYGLQTFRIGDEPDLVDRLRAILDSPGPVVCEVAAIPDEPRAPRLSSAHHPDGSIVSKPLEDLWPFLDRAEFASNMLIEPLED